MSSVGFRRILERLSEAANMAFGVHPHMLRHACGFKLANEVSIRDGRGTTSVTRTSSTPCVRRMGS